MAQSTHKRINRYIIIGLVICWTAITAIKFGWLDYSLDTIVPRQAFDITIRTRATGYGSDITIRHMLPAEELGQRIAQEQIQGGQGAYQILREKQYRQVVFNFEQHFGELETMTSFRVRPSAVRYRLPDSYPQPDTPPRSSRPLSPSHGTYPER